MSQSPKPPRARVRRVLDVEPLPAPPPLKLRAFSEFFDRGSGLPALQLEGRIGDAGFEVMINGALALHVPAETGSDEHGGFVRLLAQEHPIGAEHALRIDADAHDVDVSLAAVSYFELPRDRLARSELEYASRWYSVYFNALGLVDGCGCGGPRSLAPARLPS